MQRTHFWRKLHLHRIKITVLLFFAVISTNPASAQTPQLDYNWDTNLPNYDDRLLHYGFTLGLNSTRFRAVQSTRYLGDTVASIQSSPAGGFNLGFVVNMRLSKYFDARLLPGVAFYTRAVQYQFASGFKSNQTAESVFIEFPLLLKYKSQRRNNNRMYVVGGIKACLEAGAKKKEKKKNELRTNNIDFCVDYGFGFDLYFKYFKFAPELRFSHGLVNLLNNDPNPFSQSLTKMTTHTVTLYLHFE